MGKERIPILFLGNGHHSLGIGELHDDGLIKFKPIRSMKSPVAIKRSKIYHKLDSHEYDPITGERTGKTLRIVFKGLEDGKEFSFNESSPAELILELESLKVQNRALENNMQEMLQALNIDSIDDFRRLYAQDIVDVARKLTYSGFNNNQQQQTK